MEEDIKIIITIRSKRKKMRQFKNNEKILKLQECVKLVTQIQQILIREGQRERYPPSRNIGAYNERTNIHAIV